ncbi:unnamed protein product [Ascophyllum nodosum]
MANKATPARQRSSCGAQVEVPSSPLDEFGNDTDVYQRTNRRATKNLRGSRKP